jgi:hypothetical protein
VPVSPYLGTDIWQGKGLDGLWFNTLRLIYLHRLSAAIQGGTPLKEIVVDGIHHVFFLIEVCGWYWSSLRTWRIAAHVAMHWHNTNCGEIAFGAHRYPKRARTGESGRPVVQSQGPVSNSCNCCYRGQPSLRSLDTTGSLNSHFASLFPLSSLLIIFSSSSHPSTSLTHTRPTPTLSLRPPTSPSEAVVGAVPSSSEKVGETLLT